MTAPSPRPKATQTTLIFGALRHAGNATPSELSALLKIPATTIGSYLHKRHLRGVLDRRQEGPGFRYWIHGAPPPPPPTAIDTDGAAYVAFVPVLPTRSAKREDPATLADETVVLLAIAREPGSTTGELAEVTALGPEDLAAALRVLQKCDAIVGDRVGRETCWRVSG